MVQPFYKKAGFQVELTAALESFWQIKKIIKRKDHLALNMSYNFIRRKII